MDLREVKVGDTVVVTVFNSLTQSGEAHKSVYFGKITYVGVLGFLVEWGTPASNIPIWSVFVRGHVITNKSMKLGHFTRIKLKEWSSLTCNWKVLAHGN